MEDLTNIPDQEIVMASDNGMEEDSFQEEDFIMDNLTWTGNSAANRSIGSTTGFHNHGEGPY